MVGKQAAADVTLTHALSLYWTRSRDVVTWEFLTDCGLGKGRRAGFLRWVVCRGDGFILGKGRSGVLLWAFRPCRLPVPHHGAKWIKLRGSPKAPLPKPQQRTCFASRRWCQSAFTKGCSAGLLPPLNTHSGR